MSPNAHRIPADAGDATAEPSAGDAPRGSELVDRDDWLSRVGEVARVLRATSAPITEERDRPDEREARRAPPANS